MMYQAPLAVSNPKKYKVLITENAMSRSIKVSHTALQRLNRLMMYHGIMADFTALRDELRAMSNRDFGFIFNDAAWSGSVVEVLSRVTSPVTMLFF
jgi:hypothetical protein